MGFYIELITMKRCGIIFPKALDVYLCYLRVTFINIAITVGISKLFENTRLKITHAQIRFNQ